MFLPQNNSEKPVMETTIYNIPKQNDLKSKAEGKRHGLRHGREIVLGIQYL